MYMSECAAGLINFPCKDGRKGSAQPPSSPCSGRCERRKTYANMSPVELSYQSGSCAWWPSGSVLKLVFQAPGWTQANTFPASLVCQSFVTTVHAYLKVSECPHSRCGVSVPQQHRPHIHTKTRFSLQYLKYCHCAWLYKSCTRKQIS